ncbi:MAG: hypothetical protein DRJ05_10010 [Bacteroidetes bacterium]|nr:MAG: hypothetical protein DRJ05_10010 [Bacteroidota bacterium]
MEEFLPLLIGIFWLAYTLYNKGQKQKAKRGLPDGEKKSPISSILEEFLLEKEESPTIPVYSEELETNPFNGVSEGIKPIGAFQANEPKPVIASELEKYTMEGEHAFSVEELINEDSYGEESHFSGEDGFDLKKAVVYSEILNAPYI